MRVLSISSYPFEKKKNIYIIIGCINKLDSLTLFFLVKFIWSARVKSLPRTPKFILKAHLPAVSTRAKCFFIYINLIFFSCEMDCQYKNKNKKVIKQRLRGLWKEQWKKSHRNAMLKTFARVMGTVKKFYILSKNKISQDNNYFIYIKKINT